VCWVVCFQDVDLKAGRAGWSCVFWKGDCGG